MSMADKVCTTGGLTISSHRWKTHIHTSAVPRVVGLHTVLQGAVSPAVEDSFTSGRVGLGEGELSMGGQVAGRHISSSKVAGRVVQGQ